VTSRDKLHWADLIVALLPTVLYLTLGPLGLAVGSAGAAVNLAIARTKVARPIRVALALLVTFAAVVLWSWLIVMMR
jgi:hypothetical protein